MSQRHGSESSRSRGTRSAVDQSQAVEMIRSLRVAELQTFLPELGLSKVGRKADLVDRAIGTVRTMTAAQFQRLQSLHEARQGGGHVVAAAASAARSATADRNEPATEYQSMPTLNHFFSTPSSILGPKQSSSQQRFADGGSGGSGSWCPPVPVPVPQTVPVMEELSGIRFTALPFCEEVHCLIPPTNLNPINQSSSMRSLDGGRNVILQELSRTFTLTGEQANTLSMNRKILPAAAFDGYDAPAKVEFKKQLLLRFALSCPSVPSGVIDDCLPPSLCLRVNGKVCPLPPALPGKGGPKEGHRSSRPVDISALTKFSPVVANMISMTWHQPTLPYNSTIMDYSKRFVFTLTLVSKLCPEELVAKVRSRGTKSAEFTISIIRDKLRDEDAEIATTSLRASLLCPLAKMRIRNPTRSLTCTHIQCFDIHFFLQMNEKKPSWICPVCDSRIKFSDLVIDGLFTEILAADRSLGKTEVQFDEVNGQIQWSPIVKAENKKQQQQPVSAAAPPKRKSEEETLVQNKKQCHVQIITLDDDSDEDGSGAAAAATVSGNNCTRSTPHWSSSHSAPIELNLSDDDDDDDDDDYDDNGDDDDESIMDFTMATRSRPCDVTPAAAAAAAAAATPPLPASAVSAPCSGSDPFAMSPVHSDSFISASAALSAFPHSPFLSSNRLLPHGVPSTATAAAAIAHQQQEDDDDDDDDIAIIE